MDDLFGSAPAVPVWQASERPLDRLAAYAADGKNPTGRRREAGVVVELYQRREKDRAERADLSAPSLRPIGLLMLVPPDQGQQAEALCP
jgi:hypothetical protein